MQLLRNQCNRYQGSRNLDFYQMTPEVVTDIRAVLGEGPSWDAENQMLYWVDIISGLVHIHNPANLTDRTIPLQKYVSSVVPRKAGGIAVTLQHGYYSVDLASGKLEAISEEVETDIPGTGSTMASAIPRGGSGRGRWTWRNAGPRERSTCSKETGRSEKYSLECRSPTVSVGVPTIR